MQTHNKGTEKPKPISSIKLILYSNDETELEYRGSEGHLVLAIGNSLLQDSVFENIINKAQQIVARKREKEKLK